MESRKMILKDRVENRLMTMQGRVRVGWSEERYWHVHTTRVTQIVGMTCAQHMCDTDRGNDMCTPHVWHRSWEWHVHTTRVTQIVGMTCAHHTCDTDRGKLLNSTGSPAWWEPRGAGWEEGKEAQKGRSIHIIMTDSCCGVVETNTKL